MDDDNIQWNVEGRHESFPESARKTRLDSYKQKPLLRENRGKDPIFDDEFVDDQQCEKFSKEDLFREPKEMMAMSPPTGSVYLKTD